MTTVPGARVAGSGNALLSGVNLLKMIPMPERCVDVYG